jgi:4-amino-4-deoxy-L-arabinose transferase-like glycosyltransferase
VFGAKDETAPAARRADSRRTRLGLGSLVAIACACAVLLQPFGYNQGSHLALVHALADGTPRIDRFQDFSGDETFYRGHYFSNKAPGLALVSVPLFVALKAAHLPHGVHVLSLWGVVLPLLLLLLLVRMLGDRVEPGYGTAAAATLGLGSILLAYSTLYFAHTASALFGFLGFALLWREREGPPRPWLVVVAGLAAGFAVCFEYPLALVGAVVGCYAISRAPVVRRAFLYCGGVLVGVLPLLAYDAWAFGSPFRLSYGGSLVYRNLPLDVRRSLREHHLEPAGQHGVSRFHGVGLPSPRWALELMFSSRGLLTLAPVLALAAFGTILLHRRGRRAEALSVAGVVAVIVAYDSGFSNPFGGYGVGPRYLIPMLPFLGVMLAPAFRQLPVTTSLLAAISAAIVATATGTEALLPSNDVALQRLGDVADTGRWAHDLAHGLFARTVLSAAGGGSGWIGIAPFALLVAAAVVLAVRATPRPPVVRRDVETAVVVVAGWLVCLQAAPSLLHHDRLSGGATGALAVIALAAAVVVGASRTFRRGLAAAAPALPLLLLFVPWARDHRGWALVVAALALSGTALFDERLRRLPGSRAAAASPE